MNTLSLLASLGNHLWQSTVFTAVVALLVLLLKQNHARIRYCLWLTASIKFLIPLALLSGFGRQFEGIRHPSLVQPASVATAAEWNEPFAAPEIRITYTPTTLPEAKTTRRWPLFLFIIWILGSGFVAITWYRRWRRVARLVRHATPLTDGLETTLMQRLQREHRLSKPVPILATSSTIEPGLFGIFRPVLLLPIDIRQHVDAPQLEAILVHEISHAARHDNFWASIQSVTEAIFWFHPFAWWIGSRMVEERERACDEDVLRHGLEPDAYARAMVEICKWWLVSPVKSVSGVTGGDLKKRIEAIMKNVSARNLEFGKKVLLAAIGIVTIAGPVVIGLLNAPRILAQSSPGPIPKWEVISVKPCAGNAPPAGGQRGGPGAGNAREILTMQCNTLAFFIDSAYFMYANGHLDVVFPVPVSGGPDWINSERYQITAKVDGEASQEMMRGPMLQALLEDRFSLKVHREIREVPAYALSVVNGGHKLQSSPPDECIPLDSLERLSAAQILSRDRRICNSSGNRRVGPNMTRSFRGEDLSHFTQWLRGIVDRPVIDKTGLTGSYDFDLMYALDDSTRGLSSALPPIPANVGPAAAERIGQQQQLQLQHANDPAGPSIFTALQEQLGLKLDPIRGPGEFFVIDSAQRPKPN